MADMSEYPTPLSEAVMTHVRPKIRALDLGAGTGKHAEKFRKLGAIVTAVEPNVICEINDDIDWQTITVETFIDTYSSDVKFDLIFIQNLIHFLPKLWVLETLLPWVKAHTNPGGLVGIRTFTEDPYPPYAEKLSFYNSQELLEAFSDWEIIVSNTSKPMTAGHCFFMVDCAVRRPNN